MLRLIDFFMISYFFTVIYTVILSLYFSQYDDINDIIDPVKWQNPHLPEFNLSDPGGVHQGAWSPQCVDDALPLWRQTHVASRGDIERRVDAVLEILRRRDLRPEPLLPAAEHRRGNTPMMAEQGWDLRETTGSSTLSTGRTWRRFESNKTHTHSERTHTRNTHRVSKLAAALPILRWFTWAESHDLLLLPLALLSNTNRPNSPGENSPVCIINHLDYSSCHRTKEKTIKRRLKLH